MKLLLILHLLLIVVFKETGFFFLSGTGAVSASGTFIGLTDTPSAFGTAGQILQVNAAADALEFVAAPSGVTAVINDLPANGVTVERGKLYHGDGDFSVNIYTPTQDFSLTADTRPETGSDWYTMWIPNVSGIKEVDTYPAPSTVEDRDLRKLFIERDASDLIVEVRHLKTVDSDIFTMTSGSTSSESWT